MIVWTKSEEALPDYNRLVLAFCEGKEDHSGSMWPREGYAFMVRHNNAAETVADGWSLRHYDAARRQIGADFLSVTRWVYLDYTKEDPEP